MDKPYATACDENRDPILAVLRPLFQGARTVLEIGSGTGQHAVFFAAALPHLVWQASDIPARLPGIRLWLEDAGLPNLPEPLALEVGGDWPSGPYDAAFSANTAHIMGMAEVESLFCGVAQVLPAGGRFALYGPFSVGGRQISESNARFDAWLKARDPRMGVRDLDDLRRFAQPQGLQLEDDIPMPVNNRTLIWRRIQ